MFRITESGSKRLCVQSQLSHKKPEASGCFEFLRNSAGQNVFLRGGSLVKRRILQCSLRIKKG